MQPLQNVSGLVMDAKNIEQPLEISRKECEENEAGSHDAADEGWVGGPAIFEIHGSGVVVEMVLRDQGS